MMTQCSLLSLSAVSQMYLFNPKRAEAAYLEERSKLDKAELTERLAQKAKERKAAAAASVPALRPESPEPDSRKIAKLEGNDGNVNEDDSLLGHLMSDDGETAIAVAPEEPLRNEAGNLIIVRPMPLPKGFTGKTPRSLLDEALRRTDKFAKATYRTIPGSRAIRAVVSIRWESTGHVDHYGMADEACENQDQAFQYVATLALFAISPDSGTHRLLPANFRILWDELEQRKKTANYAAYDQHLEILSSVIDKRTSSTPVEADISAVSLKSACVWPTLTTWQVANGATGETVSKVKHNGPHMPHRKPMAHAEELQRQLLARQASAPYAAMLVSSTEHDYLPS